MYTFFNQNLKSMDTVESFPFPPLEWARIEALQLPVLEKNTPDDKRGYTIFEGQFPDEQWFRVGIFPC